MTALQVRLRGSAAATNFSLGDYRSELADFHRKHQVWATPPPPHPPSLNFKRTCR